MLIAVCGIRGMSVIKMVSFILLLFSNAVILCQNSNSGINTLKSEILPQKGSNQIARKVNKKEKFGLSMRSSMIDMGNSDNSERKLSRGVRGNRLIARFETIDISIVQKFAPILYFHPNEGLQCCYPSSAEEAYPRAKAGQTGKYKSPKTLDENTPCYFEALYTENGFRIKYWFWYNYNDYPTGPNLWGNHAGDWEYMEIYFENNQPYLYNFSNHKGIRAKYLQDVITNNAQVEVWVGSGSHANYESPAPSKMSSVLGFSDKVSNGGATWNTANNLVDIRNTNFCQDNFVGDWGDGKKIFGPLSRMNK